MRPLTSRQIIWGIFFVLIWGVGILEAVFPQSDRYARFC